MSAVPRGITGVIHPPPGIKDLADKTAAWVAKSGKGIEAKILSDKSNDRFKFLEDSNPYHGYYLSRIEEFKLKLNAGEEINLSSAAQAQPDASGGSSDTATAQQQPADTEDKKPTAKACPFVKDFTIGLDARADAAELEAIKLTALYVAKHGRSFLSQIAQNEGSNPRYDFLKGSNPRFSVFQQYLTAYTKILNPPKDIVQRLEEEAENRLSALTLANDTLTWRKEDLENRKLKESDAEKERNAYQMIDWHDFVVVETIEFREAGSEPPPPPPAPAPAAPAPAKEAAPEPQVAPPPRPPPPAVAEPRAEVPVHPRPPPPPGIAVAPPHAPPPPPMPQPTTKKTSSIVNTLDEDEDVTAHLRTGYVRDVNADRKRKATVLDPSGQEIQPDVADEHMRRSTINPQWQAQKIRRQNDLANTAMAPDHEVHKALSRMVKRLPGLQDDEPEDEARGSAQGVQAAAAAASNVVARELKERDTQMGNIQQPPPPPPPMPPSYSLHTDSPPPPPPPRPKQ